jgi:uncharacterized protein YhhL (DUF1145 family)
MVRRARELGCNEIRLETSPVLWDAKRMYDRYGFTAAKPEHPSARYNQVYCLRFRESPVSRQRGMQALPDTWTEWAVRTAALRSKEAGVPRQFGVGTALLMMTMFAVLFSVLRSLHVPAKEFAFIALFFFGVGAGQALLFHGQQPRRASIVMGIVMIYILGVFELMLVERRSPVALLELIGPAFCGGIMYGYLAGRLIAGVFLVRDKLTSAYRRRFPPKPEEP